MSRFSNFAVSFLDHLHPVRRHQFAGAGDVGCGGAAIGIGWPMGCFVSLRLRRRHGADRLGLSDRRRPLSLGLDPRQPLHRLGDGLAQPARPRHRARRHQRRHLVLLLRCVRRDCSASRTRSTDADRSSWSSSPAPGADQPSRHQAHGQAHRLLRLPDLRDSIALAVVCLHRAPTARTSAGSSPSPTTPARPAATSGRPYPSCWVFLLGLLLPIYTITGYDASAHTSEETIKAAHSVPRAHGRCRSSGRRIFGYLMLCAFVLMIPNMDEAAEQGWNVFFWAMDSQVNPASRRCSTSRSSSRSSSAAWRP